MLISSVMKKFDILGTAVCAVDIRRTVAAIGELVALRRGGYVCTANVHTIMTGYYDKSYRRAINSADLSVPDGMPVVWGASAMGISLKERVYGPDLLLALCQESETRGYRHFFYGATEPVLSKLRANLTKRFPKLVVAGTYAPPFRPLTNEEDREVVRMINVAEPDIVWIGLGAPKQERWMHDHRSSVKGVMIGVGAAFDFLSGTKGQAPRAMQRCGLEWLYRLLTEPRRLWRRYLIYNPLFLFHFARQLLSRRYRA